MRASFATDRPVGLGPLPVCPECGYDRRGLDRGHPCPECGLAVADDEHVVWGELPDTDSSPIASVSAIVTLFAILAFAALFASTTFRPPLAATLLVCGGLVIAMIAVERARRKSVAELPGEAHFRASPRGFGYRHGVGPVRVRAWRRKFRVRAEERKESVQVEIVRMLGPIPLWTIVAFAPAAGGREARRLAALLAGFAERAAR